MRWVGVIGRNQEQVYRAKLFEIVESCKRHLGDISENVSILGGESGLAIFFFYYSRMMKDPESQDLAEALLSGIFTKINRGFQYHTWAGGLAGIGWAVKHLIDEGFIEADPNEVLQPFDSYLHRCMIHDMADGNYDFLHGAVGVGTYFLKRLSEPESEVRLSELVSLMEKKSEIDSDGCRKWIATLDHEKGTRGYNLSLSHGMAAIIVFLSKVLEAGIAVEMSRKLLEGAVGYVLKQEIDPEKYNSHFPSWISPEYPPKQSRLAWCYGDLGVGVSLFRAGRAASNSDWKKKAMEVLLHTSRRTDVQANNVIDVGMCHGSSGIAHIFNRLYQETGKAEFKNAALYWIDQVLRMAVHPDGYAGYKQFRAETHGGWQPLVGLLEGIAGIGLTLISFLTDAEPRWDECLFLS